MEYVHDDVIKWKHFPRYCPFVRGIHRWPVNSPHKGQWRGVSMFSLIFALNKRLSRQLLGWWFETPSRPLLRHCNDIKYTDSHFTVVKVSSQLYAACDNNHINHRDVGFQIKRYMFPPKQFIFIYWILEVSASIDTAKLSEHAVTYLSLKC